MHINILTIRCLFVLTLLVSLDWYKVQHVMAQTCTNPTPLIEGSTTVDATSAPAYSVPYRLGQCLSFDVSVRGVWYTVTNPTNVPIEYAISTDFPETVVNTDIGIFSGTCTNLVCLGGNNDINGSLNQKSLVRFTAAPQSSYYILMFNYGFLGAFKASLSRALAPTNPPTQQPTYTPTTSPTKQPTNTPTTSPTKQPTQTPTTSPTKQPTATPTTSPTKQPTHTPTTSPTKQPSVSPSTTPTTVPSKSPSASPTSTPTRDCDITYNLYNSRMDQIVSSIMNSRTIVNSLPPCGRVNIEAVVPCGVSSPNDSVIIELYRGTRLFARRIEYYEKYFLFGNSGTNIYDGKIPAGTYSIRTIVDGITSPFTNFTVGGRCK